MQFAYKILSGIIDIETIQQCLASTLHRKPEATITNCLSREAGCSPENTSSVKELLHPARALQILPYFSFLFLSAVDLTKLHRSDRRTTLLTINHINELFLTCYLNFAFEMT
jgi:hypothetical protein